MEDMEDTGYWYSNLTDHQEDDFLNFGEFAALLRTLPSTANVYLDPKGNYGLCEMRSYRGAYYNPSFVVELWGDNTLTVGEMLALCDEALAGKSYTGYKGGEFVFDERCELYFSEYEVADGWRPVGVELLENGDVWVKGGKENW